MTLKEDLLAKMQELGIEPKRSLGQNFLISERVVSEIFQHVDRRAPKFIIEIGPGLGALTERLVERATPFKLIELDRLFAQYWRKRGAEVIEQDALQLNWPNVVCPEGTLLLSNLPYQIGSRLVIDLSLGPAHIDVMVLMFQKEVAERLVAETRTKDYGFLSVVAQTFWSIGRVVDASREDFFPPPNVNSRVLSLKRKRVTGDLGLQYIEFIKKAFQFRRKFMLKSFQENQDKVRESLRHLGYKETVRAEEISPESFQKLYFQIYGN